MHRLIADFTLAVRSLRRSPAFTATALITLALGIGATTAIFSVVNAVLLRPLPYREPGRLVLLWADLTKRNVRDFPVFPGDIPDVRAGVTALREVSGVYTTTQTVFDDNAAPERVRVAVVLPNFFATLGVGVALGRPFVESDGMPQPRQGSNPGGPADALTPRSPDYVVLSHEFWTRRFGADSAVVGRSVNIGGQECEVVGILLPGFEILFPPGTGVERRPDLYQATRLDLATASRMTASMRVFGRLADGATMAAAQQQATAVSEDLTRRYQLHGTAGVRWRVEPMHRDLVEDVKPAILILMGAVAFVLLIACANVASLLLVRASLRAPELAVRTALGASRGALIRQMLAESLLLGVAGGAIGLYLADGGIALLTALAPANIPLADHVGVDPVVLTFTLAACLASALVFGAVPALRASRLDVTEALRAGGRNAGLARGGRLRDVVVIAEVALCFVLLVGSGLMARTFITLQRIAPGYDPKGLLTFEMGFPPLGSNDERRAFRRRVQERLAALPGVTAVAASDPLPLDGRTFSSRWGVEGTDPSLFQQANLYAVVPGYFEALGTRLVAGRTFTSEDNRMDIQRVVVDDILARSAFGDQNAVGRHILARVRTNEPERWEIIGVVEHQRRDGLAAPGRQGLYFAEEILGPGRANKYALRTDGDVAALVPALRTAVRELDPRLALADIRPMQALIDRAMGPTRFALVLIVAFAAIAAVLAGVGLYGVLSTLVRHRTPELGVRMALGAPRSYIVRLVMRHGLRLSAIGVGAGLVGALALTQGMRNMLVGVAPTDPLTFIAMVAFFAAVAAAASYLPARRAAALDPNAALRQE
jgi:putative ABC transport system permease protein